MILKIPVLLRLKLRSTALFLHLQAFQGKKKVSQTSLIIAVGFFQGQDNEKCDSCKNNVQI